MGYQSENGVGTNFCDSLACSTRLEDIQHINVPLPHHPQDKSKWQTLWAEQTQRVHIPTGNSTIAFGMKQ